MPTTGPAAVAMLTGFDLVDRPDAPDTLTLHFHVSVAGRPDGVAGTINADVEIGYSDSTNTLAGKVSTGLRAALSAAGFNVANGRLTVPSFVKV